MWPSEYPNSMARVKVLVLALAIAAGAAQPLPAQAGGPSQVLRADGAISGVVRDAITSQPVVDAIVHLWSPRLRGTPQVLSRTVSDTQGRYVFTDLLPDSEYTLTVERRGYFASAFGSIGPLSPVRRAIVIREGEWFSAGDLKMWRPGSISGTVTDERGEPMVGVLVRAVTRIRVAGVDHLVAGSFTMTDDRGIYRIAGLGPGQYFTTVPSVQSTVPASTSASGILGLSQSTIDSYRNAGRALPREPAMMELDDAARLAVGGYPVPPPPVDGRRFSYPIALSRNGTPAQPVWTALDAGVDLQGLDIQLRPVAAVRISGIVEGPQDARANLVLRLIAEGFEGLGAGSEAGTSLTAADGSFTFANVPAGDYVITTTASLSQYGMSVPDFFYEISPQPMPGLAGMGYNASDPPATPPGIAFRSVRAGPSWLRVTLSVGDSGLSNVRITPVALATLRGRYVDDGPDEPNRFRSIALETATGSVDQGWRSSAAGPNQGAAFAIPGIVPGLYVFHSTSSLTWSIKSVVIGGLDYSQRTIDVNPGVDLSNAVVTFTKQTQPLSGTVRRANGAKESDAAVIVFPADSAGWTNYGLRPTRIKTALVSSDGTYRVTALPASEYLIVAVPSARMNAWHDPEFFERAAVQATRITLEWGKPSSADLRVVDIP